MGDRNFEPNRSQFCQPNCRFPGKKYPVEFHQHLHRQCTTYFRFQLLHKVTYFGTNQKLLFFVGKIDYRLVKLISNLIKLQSISNWLVNNYFGANIGAFLWNRDLFHQHHPYHCLSTGNEAGKSQKPVDRGICYLKRKISLNMKFLEFFFFNFIFL